MHLTKLGLLVGTILMGVPALAIAPQTSEPWEFSCRKFEERTWIQCGPSSFQLERKMLLTNTYTTLVGTFTLVNRSGEYRQLETIEVSPDCKDQTSNSQYCFSGPNYKIIQARPGRKSHFEVRFTGHRAGQEKIDVGTYEGTMKMRDKPSGRIYEFSMTVHAYKPRQRS